MKLITNPDEFFKESSQKDVRIRIPMLIVVALAIVVSAYQYLLMSKISQAFPPDLARFFVVGAYIGIVGSFIGMFAVWLMLAVIMHELSAFFDGKGTFRRTFEFVGYGFLPSLVSSLISVPMSAYYVINAEIPKITVEQLQQNSDVMKSLVLSIVPNELIYSNLMINLAVTAWSLTIWSFALKHAKEIELRKALICALIPTLLFGIYRVLSIMKLL